jgi:hypothetical protein
MSGDTGFLQFLTILAYFLILIKIILGNNINFEIYDPTDVYSAL